jgi:hypothetical protein
MAQQLDVTKLLYAVAIMIGMVGLCLQTTGNMTMLFFWAVTPERWRQYVSPKQWYLSMRLHSITTYKNNTIIFTAMRTSNLSTGNISNTT